MQLTVTVQPGVAATVLSVQGELDMATAETLWAQVQDVLESPPNSLLLDLTDLDFLDSSGCRGLLRAARAGERVGVPVAIVVPPTNGSVRRVVEFMQFRELLPVLDERPPA